MTNANIREAHKLLDALFDNSELSHKQIDLIRGLMPELPKQKTLEEITEHVYDAWIGTNENEWPDDIHGDLETWLAELHTQLKGLKDTPIAVPALPAGMRIAVHPDYGRVVVSPDVDLDGFYEIYYLDPGMSSGTDISWVEPDSLTFIDSEPAKPAHPEFLETEADYQNAPDGTIVAVSGSKIPTVKDDGWPVHMAVMSRRILRWGTGE